MNQYWKRIGTRKFHAKAFVNSMSIVPSLGLLFDIEKLEEQPGLSQAICRPLLLAKSYLVSILDITVKTHKHINEVSCRNLHCSSGYSLKGLGHWARDQIRQWLREVPHLIIDTAQFIQSIKTNKALKAALLL